MSSHSRREKVCSVDIDSPELPHTVDGVVDRLEVLGEPGGCDEVIDLAMLLNNLRYASIHGRFIGDVGIMSRDSGQPVICQALATMVLSFSVIPKPTRPNLPLSAGIVLLECLDNALGLFLRLLLVQVYDGQIGTGDNQALAHHQAQTAGTASDDADLALEGEGR